MKNCLLLCVAVLALAVGVPASAQYMYLDENGDGVCTSDDIIDNTTTSVDVWLSTNKNGDGSDAFCATGEAISIFSYTFILRVEGSALDLGLVRTIRDRLSRAMRGASNAFRRPGL